MIRGALIQFYDEELEAPLNADRRLYCVRRDFSWEEVFADYAQRFPTDDYEFDAEHFIDELVANGVLDEEPMRAVSVGGYGCVTYGDPSVSRIVPAKPEEEP